MRVSLHRFQTYEGHVGCDGANLAYEEIFRLLEEQTDLVVQPHDLVDLLADDGVAYSALATCDVVVAAAGPHAHMYFYFRERFDLHYRIVRDVRTALWNGYLLQESLVGPYVRPGDIAIYSTAYSRDLFRSLFPQTPHESQHVCYPLMRWFPPLRPRPSLKPKHPVTIGFVGRLTADKNFPQALDLIAQLHRRRPGRFELCAVGQGRPPYGTRDAPKRLGRATRAYRWRPPVKPEEIWCFYDQFDLLFFPSTSTIETFGRTVVEAGYAGLPVLASSHGGPAELLEPGALLPTTYDVGRRFTTHFAAPLGEVNIEEAAERIIDRSIPLSHAHDVYRNDPSRLLALLREGAAPEVVGRTGTPAQAAFISRVAMRDLTPLRSIEDADQAIARLRPRFVALHRRGLAYPLALLELLARSRYRRKTLSFIRGSVLSGEDLTHIGGIDLEFAHLLRFYPWFTI